MKRLFFPLVAALALQAQLPRNVVFASPNADTDDETLLDDELNVDTDILDTRQDAKDLVSRDQNRTRYPIVFVHGFMGWDEVLNIDYFYQVKKTLQQAGYEVYTPIVNPINSVEIRTRQLAPQRA